MKRQLAVFSAIAALLMMALPGIAAAANTQVVEGKVINGHGTLLVASSNKMTVYTFDKDVKDSGVSACTGQCLVNWPALTMTAGDVPTGGAGVGGKLATIVRTDNGATQVTYDGLPLYFFINDKAPGDANGIYTNWRAIVLAAEATPAPAATQAPSVTPPPTATTPDGGSTPSRDSTLFMLAFAIGGLGLIVAIRRLSAARR